MLVALSGVLCGYDGRFPFGKPGDVYTGVPYAAMRTVGFISIFLLQNLAA